MELVDDKGQAIQSIENVKTTILLIERFCGVLNNMQVPTKFAQSFLDGYGFLSQMHTQLLAQLTPEQIEQMKKDVNPPSTGAN